MSDLLPCPFCGEAPSIMSAGMAGQPRWQHPVNDTCPIAGHYLGGWDFPEQWNRRALPAVQPMTVQETACCEYCDGTGDVHAIDGEWRGYCSCGAGATIRALPAAQPHVNETPKSEHVPGDVLTPATKGGAHD